MPSINFDHNNNLIYSSNDGNGIIWDDHSSIPLYSQYIVSVSSSYAVGTEFFVKLEALEKSTTQWAINRDFRQTTGSNVGNFIVTACTPQGSKYNLTLSNINNTIPHTLSFYAGMSRFEENGGSWNDSWVKATNDSYKHCATHLALRVSNNSFQVISCPLNSSIEVAVMDSDNPLAPSFQNKYLVTRDSTYSTYLYMKELYPDIDSIFADSSISVVDFTLGENGRLKIWSETDSGFKQYCIRFYKNTGHNDCYFIVTLYDPIHVSFKDGGKYKYVRSDDGATISWYPLDNTIYSDYLEPTDDIGINGDYYLQTASSSYENSWQNDKIYVKENGHWVYKNKNDYRGRIDNEFDPSAIYIFTGANWPNEATFTTLTESGKTVSITPYDGDIYLMVGTLILEPAVLLGDASRYEHKADVPNGSIWHDKKTHRLVYSKRGSIYYIIESGKSAQDTMKYIRTNLMMDDNYLFQDPMDYSDFRYD